MFNFRTFLVKQFQTTKSYQPQSWYDLANGPYNKPNKRSLPHLNQNNVCLLQASRAHRTLPSFQACLPSFICASPSTASQAAWHILPLLHKCNLQPAMVFSSNRIHTCSRTTCNILQSIQAKNQTGQLTDKEIFFSNGNMLSFSLCSSIFLDL